MPMEQILWDTSRSTKMRAMDFGCAVVVLFGLLIAGNAEIYIVTIEGEPIISYKGGVPGFEATAVESDETLDVTRYRLVFVVNLLSYRPVIVILDGFTFLDYCRSCVFG